VTIVRGYRYWNLVYKSGRYFLKSPVTDQIWPDKRLEAVCPYGDVKLHLAQKECDCGIYSAKSLPLLFAWQYTLCGLPHSYRVVGTIDNYGYVVIYEEEGIEWGYRSEMCEISSILELPKKCEAVLCENIAIRFPLLHK